MVTIPLRTDLLWYELRVELDGVRYVLELRWSAREEAWYLDLKTAAGEVMAHGLKVLVDLPLGRRITDERKPPGVLIAVDTSGAHLDPGETDLGGRVQLYYLTAVEVVDLLATDTEITTEVTSATEHVILGG